MRLWMDEGLDMKVFTGKFRETVTTNNEENEE